jgi:hypothetical protein
VAPGGETVIVVTSVAIPKTACNGFSSGDSEADTFDAVQSAKPLAEILTLQSPGFKDGILKLPSTSVTVVRRFPSSSSTLTLTTAAKIGAPDESVTLPWIEPLACAIANCPANQRKASTVGKTFFGKSRAVQCPQPNSGLKEGCAN